MVPGDVGLGHWGRRTLRPQRPSSEGLYGGLSIPGTAPPNQKRTGINLDPKTQDPDTRVKSGGPQM